MSALRLCLALGLLVAVEGCCSGVKTPAARKSFIDSFNDKKNGCVLTGTSSDLTSIELSCASQELAKLAPQVKGTCGAYQLVGFATMALKAKDGSATCDLSKDCSCD